LFELIKARGLVAYPDAALRLAISRAVAVETPRGWKISKEKQAHKIDVVVALAMAAHAAVLGSRVPPQPNIHVPIDLSVASYGPLPGSMSDSWSPPYNW
jgi:phage terminase large subunit-like protein